jgi:hypothetical protein
MADSIMADIIMADPSPLDDYSDEQTKVLDAMEAEARSLFPPSSTVYYANVATLQSAVQQWANAKGAQTSYQSHGFWCKRAAAPPAFEKAKTKARIKNNTPLELQRETSSMRCGCKFVIKFTDATPKSIRGGVAPKSVRITAGSSYRHTNGCFPSQCQLIVDKKSSGSYQDKVKLDALKDILAVLKPGRPVNCQLLREMMRPLYPKTIAITAQDVWNMRLKVKKLLFEAESSTLDTSQGISDSTAENLLPRGDNEFVSLDELPAEFLPVASELATEILKVALLCGNDAAVIEAYLQKLHVADPNFTFRISRASDGSPCGYVWQTATMRADWEDYGNVVFLDAMKRQVNSIHWPYIGVCILDGYNKVAVVCESICIGEKIMGYAWIMRMLASMGPRRQLSRVSVIFGDGIFAGDSLLEMLKIENTCKLCQDTYHLISATNGAWAKFFGPHYWPRFSEDFRGLVYSYTEEDYMSKYERLRGRLTSECPSDSKGVAWIGYLETSVHGHRHQFVRAYVQEYWYNREREGTVPAEINHASYVARIGPVSVEEPAKMVEQTLNRHSDICKERNEGIVRYKAQCIARAATGRMELQDKIALLALSKGGYELWEEARDKSLNYGCIVQHDNRKLVRRNGLTEGGRDVGDGTKCICQKRKAFVGQCEHLVKGNDGIFILALWDTHWLQRTMLRRADASEEEEARQLEENGYDQSQHVVYYDNDNEETDEGQDPDDAQRPPSTNDDDGRRPAQELPIPSDGDAAGFVRRELVADVNSVNFSDIMVICQDLAHCILKSKDIPTQVGMLLQWTENLKSVPQGTDMHEAVAFAETFNVHMSAFSRHKSTANDLFTTTQNEDGVLQSDPLRRQGQQRHQGGRLLTKRLKTNKEKAMRGLPIGKVKRGLPIALSQSTPRQSACSFCCLPGHKRGANSCLAYRALKCNFLNHDNDFQRWSTRLGDPNLHLVVTPSRAEMTLFGRVDLTAVIPPAVHHVVLTKCFYSKDHVEYMRNKYSQYRATGRNELTPPSMEYNVVEVILLVKGAQRYQKDSNTPCFMFVKTVREWIVKNYKKTGNKYVLNSLAKAALNDIANTY